MCEKMNGTDKMADTMMMGAIDYCFSKGEDPRNHAEAIIREIKAEVSGTMDEALDDAKVAYDVGMDEAAAATFTASLRLGGIRAAQRVIGDN